MFGFHLRIYKDEEEENSFGEEDEETIDQVKKRYQQLAPSVGILK